MLLVFLILKFVCQVLVQAQLIKSEPQLNPATVMYTTAPMADVTVTSSGTPTPAPASIHTLVNTAHGAILATGEFHVEMIVIGICDFIKVLLPTDAQKNCFKRSIEIYITTAVLM
jgi:hypothetical protein